MEMAATEMAAEESAERPALVATWESWESARKNVMLAFEAA